MAEIFFLKFCFWRGDGSDDSSGDGSGDGSDDGSGDGRDASIV